MTGAVSVTGSAQTEEYQDVMYPQSFPPTGSVPVIFSQVMTNNDEKFVKSRQRRGSDVNQGGATRVTGMYSEFSIKLESARDGGVHGTETVAWLAIQESRESHIGTKLFEALSTPLSNAAGEECSPNARDECNGVRHDPYSIRWQSSFGFRPQVFASIATSNGPYLRCRCRTVLQPSSGVFALMSFPGTV